MARLAASSGFSSPSMTSPSMANPAYMSRLDVSGDLAEPLLLLGGGFLAAEAVAFLGGLGMGSSPRKKRDTRTPATDPGGSKRDMSRAAGTSATQHDQGGVARAYAPTSGALVHEVHE